MKVVVLDEDIAIELYEIIARTRLTEFEEEILDKLYDALKIAVEV